MGTSELERLRRLPLFASVPDFALAELADIASIARYSRGNTVFYEGDTANLALLVLEGRLEARVDTHPGWRKVGTIAPGEVVGEQALFVAGAHRNATVVATEDVFALQLTPDVLRRGAYNDALIAVENHLLGTLARRIRTTNQAIKVVWKEQPMEQDETAPTTIRGRLQALFSRIGLGA